MRKFFKEFKAFISRGNVFNLAVGMIIATAFNKIVSSLVNDIIMSLVTWATGAASLKDLSLPLRRSINPATELEEVTLSWAYGNFLQTVIDFLIIALSVFLMVKVMNSSRNKLKALNEFAKTQSNKEIRAEKKQLKAQTKSKNRPYKEVLKEHEEKKAKELEEQKLAKELEEKKQAEEYALAHPSSETLLAEIRDLLKDSKKKK